ncbi:helix-turn-helix transcriptional regulator [Allostreptomyces psammosilenae]|uniref:Transcriptional regulator with XRE-family HTH domain n=1 Tax=Allostreptomyces psammosilenae TaxID=1892865 RepID=A0A853A4R1_9ACTN|nr:helix-turn-helix transcriptional regulator [Allostreptomyces psammosilenae]NYI07864.1 transcriptional regulator with XRE-family HTH domain [Allostreptomyces psammosilenae]
MDRHAELGEFLRSRRARLRPEELGLPDYGSRRRVPGLRREELAQLAGVSAGYYTRLEQGQCRGASDAVLDAIARVLRLDDAERAHLYSLARPRPATRRRSPRPEQLRPAVRTMIESFGEVPALVLGRVVDILAWNPMAHALLAGHLDRDAPHRPADRPNFARMLFLDPHTRELYGDDWTRKARSTVADLRMIAGRHPDVPGLAALVGELTVASPEFARLWAAHTVGDCRTDSCVYHHPVVGAMELTVELMALPNDEGQRVAVFNAEPGSPSEAALRLLARLAGPRVEDPPPPGHPNRSDHSKHSDPSNRSDPSKHRDHSDHADH